LIENSDTPPRTLFLLGKADSVVGVDGANYPGIWMDNHTMRANASFWKKPMDY